MPKKAPKYWEKYGYRFLDSPHKMCFATFPLAYGILIGKPMHFPCHEEYHRTEI